MLKLADLRKVCYHPGCVSTLLALASCSIIYCSRANFGFFSRMANRTFVVEPTGQHTASVVFLHGLGDTGEGWCENFRQLARPHVRYIFPTAPIRQVTLNFGMPMPAWFDIKDLSPRSSEDEQGIIASSQTLRQIVDAEIKERNIDSKRIVIGGFSQGGAVALYGAFSNTQQFPALAGIVALSCWMPLRQQWEEQRALGERGFSAVQNLETPMFQAHGKRDPLVPYAWGETTHTYIKTVNKNAEFHGYNNLEHSSSIEEMRDVMEFLNKVIG